MFKEDAIKILVNHAKRCPETAPTPHGHLEDYRDDYNEWHERCTQVREAIRVLSAKTIKYVVLAGWVHSRNDGQEHFINHEELIKLYGLNRDECVLVNYTFSIPKQYTCLPVLEPRYDGDYKGYLQFITNTK